MKQIMRHIEADKVAIQIYNWHIKKEFQYSQRTECLLDTWYFYHVNTMIEAQCNSMKAKELQNTCLLSVSTT